MIITEEWRDINFVDWFNLTRQPNMKYQVSNFGKVRSITNVGKKITIMQTHPKSNDKRIHKPEIFGINIGMDKKKIELDNCVACAFLDPSKSFFRIEFKDGNASNCALSNLTVMYLVPLANDIIPNLVNISNSSNKPIIELINDIVAEAV